LLVIEELLDLIRLMVENVKKYKDKIKLLKIVNVVFNEMRHREITKHLLTNKVYAINDFMWQNIPKLSYNLDSDINRIDNVLINLLFNDIQYGYEYYGMFEKKV